MLTKISFAAALIAAQTYAVGVDAEAMMYRARPRFSRGSLEYVTPEETEPEIEANNEDEESRSSGRRGPRGPSRRRGRQYTAPQRGQRGQQAHAPAEEILAAEGVVEEAVEGTEGVEVIDIVDGVEGVEGEIVEDAEPAIPDEKAGWFNEFQRFSNPYITYEPAPLTSAQYGMCTFSSTKDVAGMVRLVQFPGKAVIASVELEGVNLDEQYEMKIRQFGFLGAGESFCMASGPEFNPLREVDRRG